MVENWTRKTSFLGSITLKGFALFQIVLDFSLVHKVVYRTVSPEILTTIANSYGLHRRALIFPSQDHFQNLWSFRWHHLEDHLFLHIFLFMLEVLLTLL